MASPARAAVLLGALAFVAAPAAAQYRPADSVEDLTTGRLASLVRAQHGTLASCAGGADTDAYLAEVRARVAPGPAPSTLYNARIQVTVRTRPRDHEVEACVRRRVIDALRHEPYAVTGRAITARHTYSIEGRRAPPIQRPAPAYSEGEVHRVLERAGARFQRCLESAGIADTMTLHVAVEADGRLTLMNAQVPSGAPSRALGCLSQEVGRLRVASRPPRRQRVVHSVRLR